MDGRVNNGGKREGAGSKGFGRLNRIRENVDKYSELWWNRWEQSMTSDDKQERLHAMTEFNKLQCKMIPTEVTGAEGGEILIKIAKEISDKNETDESASGNSEGHDEV